MTLLYRSESALQSNICLVQEISPNPGHGQKIVIVSSWDTMRGVCDCLGTGLCAQ